MKDELYFDPSCSDYVEKFPQSIQFQKAYNLKIKHDYTKRTCADCPIRAAAEKENQISSTCHASAVH